jgi:protoporphyrinogen oxidase
MELVRRSDRRVIVLEADSQVGGISKTVVYRGNRMDLGGHRFFSKSDWVMRWWQQILPVAVHLDQAFDISYQQQTRTLIPEALAAEDASEVMLVRPRLSRIFYKRKFFDYPLKLNAMTIRNLGLGSLTASAMSYAKARIAPRWPEKTVEDFFINRFGERLYRTFFKDYTEKVWGVSCSEISAEWGAQRVKGLSITKALLHALSASVRRQSDVEQKSVETSLIERFLYPRLGPGQMWEKVARLATQSGAEIRLQTKVIGLQRSGERITAVETLDLRSDERHVIACDELISTMPIAQLVEFIGPHEQNVAQVASALPYRDFMTVGLIVRKMKPFAACANGAGMPPDNWIYIQEPDVRLGRLQIFNNWSPDLVADPNTVSLGLEYFCTQGDDLWSTPDQAFQDFAAEELSRLGLIDPSDILDATTVRVPKAYPAYFGSYAQFDSVREYLSQFSNLYPVGRNGMHRYNNQDHSMLAANAAVDSILSGTGDKTAMWKINTESDYHEEHQETSSQHGQRQAA